jgi:hypothetical protein
MANDEFMQWLRNRKAAMIVAGLQPFGPNNVPYNDPKWIKHNKALKLLDRSFKQ